jgi:predicted protein tyrosine phosphatase
MINIFVWPEIAMRKTTIDFKDNVVISITSPGSEHVSIKGTNVHKFHFHDVREPLELMDGSTMLPMSEEIAESIAQIIVDNRDKRVWMINCEAGISRSPGIAIGIASVLKTDPDIKKLKQQFPCFNTHVAKLIEESIKIKLIELEK